MKDHNATDNNISSENESGNALLTIERNVFFAIGILFFLFFLPIAIYRTITESWQLAVLDWLVMLVSAIMLAYGWLSNQVRVASFIYNLFLGCAVIAGTLLINPNLILYAGPVVLLGFYLLPLNLAIIACGAPIGGLLVFMIATKVTVFAPILIILFTILGIAVASRYARSQLEKLSGMVDPDSLSLLLNRKANIRGEASTENFRNPEKSATALLIFSFENLNNLNDTYGHLTAESIITHAIALLTDKVRLKDRIYISGNDTFLLCIDGIDTDDADHLAEKFGQTLNSSTVIRDYKLTVSIKVAGLLNKDEITGWIKRGDQVLPATQSESRNGDLIAANGSHGLAT